MGARYEKYVQSTAAKLRHFLFFYLSDLIVHFSIYFHNLHIFFLQIFTFLTSFVNNLASVYQVVNKLTTLHSSSIIDTSECSSNGYRKRQHQGEH